MIVTRIGSFSIIFVSRRENSPKDGKDDSNRHLLYSLARTGDNSGEHIFRTIDDIQSGPVELATSTSHIAFATILTVILIEKIFCSVPNGKSRMLCNTGCKLRLKNLRYMRFSQQHIFSFFPITLTKNKSVLYFIT